ncbi:acyltransferase family protein [Streptomyces sp. WMMB 322]|uniref:acyltransferase family protein n=1 Tax=Streptomyces sp. WMMB 322 TaxID=1286821 RepID=UPI000823F2AC|nr:acyltransferase family protein [Streptomyces sp. WMMB 322]SCK10603.1 Fucose 4-O-acetylase [Streptomyces sp. WMMB 322]
MKREGDLVDTGRGTHRSTKRQTAASAGSARTPPPARKVRDPHWDNVRFLSGTLVLTGHLIEPIAHLDGLRWLYVTSWAMRVPVFVIVAGYFSSAGPLGRRELRQLTESVLAPYLLISLLHTAQIRLLYGNWKFFTSEPAWGLWFLLSLFVWRMLLPYLAVLRYPLSAAMAAALAVGHLDGFTHTFSASRTVAFLPFFLLGRQLRQGLADQLLHTARSREAAAGVLAVTATACWFLRHDIDVGWLAMNAPYGETVSFAPAWAWGLRGTVLLCGMLIALSFIRLVPKRRLPVVTYLGAGGLYIYLLHPLVLRVFFRFGGLGWVGPWPEQTALLVLGGALAAALASPWVRRVTKPVVQPRLRWLYAPEPSREAPGTPAPSAARHGSTPHWPAPPQRPGGGQPLETQAACADDERARTR